jgi:hypothetical protein
VASAWQKKLSRLTRIDRKEACTRLGQGLAKRLDLALYRTRLGQRAPHLRQQTATLGKFFFRGDEIEHRITLLRTYLPHDADAIIHEADAICRHEFQLLGHDTVEYGKSIDWHSDPVHRRSSALTPWFKIDFLNYEKVGDHKVIWELNRHQHLVTLAKAWLLSGNPTYAQELAAQFYSWLKANPYPLGINWASTLEVAFRSMSWLWVRNLLTVCPALPASFHTDVLLSLQAHARYLERYLSTYFSPNTHLLGEGVALFFVGTLRPEIPAAPRWQQQGWRIVLEESERQVRSDGVYFEQSLYYHVYALDFFLHARLLASENGFPIPEQFDNVLKKMLDVVHALSELGPPESFGDDDGGRVFNPRRNRAECMTDPLGMGAILYDCDKYAAAGLTEEAIWLFGDKAIKAFARPPASTATSSKDFEAGGIYLINDDQPHPQQLMIDAGPQGTGNSGHGHADALSIRFSLDGRRFLVDPGTCCYICDGGDRNEFRGTGAHNTLRVDSLDQAVPQGPFAWSAIPNAKAETWLNGQTFDFFVGSHDGYGRLPDAVLHRRFVFHVKGGLWFVRDVAEGGGTHLLETFWHFAPDLELREEGRTLFAESSTDKATQRSGLALLIDHNSAWTTEIRDGLVSPAYGSKQVAPVVRASANVTLPEDCGVLLVPMAKVSEVGTFSGLGGSTVHKVHGYRYQTAQNTEFLFFAPGNRDWTCGPWSSDARLLYCKLERGRFTHVIMVSGSFGEWRGKRFVSRQSPTESFEWLSRPGWEKASTLPGSILDGSVVGDFEVFDSVS